MPLKLFQTIVLLFQSPEKGRNFKKQGPSPYKTGRARRRRLPSKSISTGNNQLKLLLNSSENSIFLPENNQNRERKGEIFQILLCTFYPALPPGLAMASSSWPRTTPATRSAASTVSTWGTSSDVGRFCH